MAFMRSLSDHHWMCDKDAMRIDLFSVRFVLFLSPLQSKTVKEVVQRSIQTGVSYLAEQISSSIEDYTQAANFSSGRLEKNTKIQKDCEI